MRMLLRKAYTPTQARGRRLQESKYVLCGRGADPGRVPRALIDLSGAEIDMITFWHDVYTGEMDEDNGDRKLFARLEGARQALRGSSAPGPEGPTNQ